jgi:Tfp pilus assembly protein PilF
MGLYNEALRDLDKAIELDKNDADSFINRGKIYGKLGKKELAIEDFRKACDMGSEEGCGALEAFEQ